MTMEPQIIQGIWDEVVPLHSADLKGHRVEIRILDGYISDVTIDHRRFEASMLRIAELTRGAARISAQPLRAEDFYESAE